MPKYKKKTKVRLPRTIDIAAYQTGERKSIHQDRMLKSLKPGKRISEFSNIYWETRKNRSDKKHSRL